MTVIVAAARGGKLAMGADSLTLTGSEKSIRTVPKVFQSGPLLIGVSGSPRISDAMRYAGPQPFMDMNRHPHELMVTAFIPWLRDLAKDHGLLMGYEGADVLLGHSHIIVGYRDAIFTIGYDFATVTHARGYAGIGSASSYALGAMHAAWPSAALTATQIVRYGLHAAVEFSADAEKPLTVLEMTTPVQRVPPSVYPGEVIWPKQGIGGTP